MLHLVMPANSINFLNGMDSSSPFSSAENMNNCQGQSGQGIQADFDNLMLEVSCKITEINKVYYKTIDDNDANQFAVANITR